MTGVTLTDPWLEFDLGQEMRVLSWAINRPGFVSARRILWREVRNADLPRDLDVHAWLSDELDRRASRDAVTFLTSRPLRHFTQNVATVEAVTAHAVATVGFSNAERVGYRIDRACVDWGTINVAVRLNAALTQAALLEAMSIAVEARTAAVMDAGHVTPRGVATGTGTDCVAVASPPGTIEYSGMHTDIGEAIGRVVYTAVLDGAQAWVTSMKETGNAAT